MATIVLSAAGMALGGSIGGSVLGISTAVLGRAAGAMLGRAIDERLLGRGSAPVETGRVDRFRLTGASEGRAVGRIWGRMRTSGQVIWTGPFVESRETTGGKGGPPEPRTTTFSYSVSFAVALCEGEITHVGRIWADGEEIAPDDLNLRVYTGSETQQPDPAILAVEGAAPAYRGIAYVVVEDLALARFGNRVPQLSFEVFRPARGRGPSAAEDIARLVTGVAMIPGTGEYALATDPVYLGGTYGETTAVNLNSPSCKADLPTSLDSLEGEMPNCRAVSLVVSWFGSDLRAGSCEIRPKVEQAEQDAEGMPWRVSGRTRATAGLVAREGDRPVYGGTPADAAVVQAIGEMTSRGQAVMFYPFILMEQLSGNGLPDPYGRSEQPPLPWRGRITTALAPDRAGTTDGTAAAEAEVAAFFGAAQPAHFTVNGTTVGYAGPADWGLRRMILHYAHLCAAAGGVDSFCIGSEMVALARIRGQGGSFPAVAAFRQLAAEVKAILPGAKIGYAADWSEYHGYQPPGTADKLFHLDPLWADASVDFIGIDNYMPLSDWRDGDGHADAGHGAIHDLDYLAGNVAGGELFDWYYASEADRRAQVRTPITDGQGEPWLWRVKDLKGWWSNPHHDRIGGVRQAAPTAWVPQSKPIWFTELGCAAIDKGTNQPNKFLDPKSSESALPHFSNGIRDDLIQMQYLRAMFRHFADPVANPVSTGYGAPMLDLDRMFVWAWDARPFPAFPADDALWSDGDNYARGHWLNGRASSRSLASVVGEICAGAGVTRIDTSRLHGLVRGYQVDDVATARSALQSLMIAHGFDAVERDGVLHFVSRTGGPVTELDPDLLAQADPDRPTVERTRASAAEVTGTVRLTHVDAEADYDVAVAQARAADEVSDGVSASELAMALTRAEGRRVAERWLSESRLSRDSLRLALPPSRLDLGAGDVIRLAGDAALWRIDRVEATEAQALEAVRIEPWTYVPHETAEEVTRRRRRTPPVPVEALFLDLPLLKGDEVPHAPHLALSARTWPGPVAVYASDSDADYVLDGVTRAPATVGTTLTALAAAAPGVLDRGPALRVRLVRGGLQSVGDRALLSGANAMAIGDGAVWEVFQFRDATLTGPDTYDLSLRLRGQAGTDGTMPGVWPVGSRVVLLDDRVGQLDLAPGALDLARHYRWGPAARPLDHGAYRHAERAFEGAGLRPYRPCHLRGAEAGGDLRLTWVRRTRVDGDGWRGADVPLGEAVESYRVAVTLGGATLREAVVGVPAWTYAAAERAADGPGVRIEVAQLSAVVGAGPAAIWQA